MFTHLKSEFSAVPLKLPSHDTTTHTHSLTSSYNTNTITYHLHQHAKISSFSCDSGNEISCQTCLFAHRMPSIATFPGYK